MIGLLLSLAVDAALVVIALSIFRLAEWWYGRKERGRV